MRIHSDILTPLDFVNAANRAQVGVIKLTEHGSRSRARSFDFTLTGTSPHWRNGGNYGANTDDKAASWDEWGMVFNHLFDIDPNAHCGRIYLSGEHFHWSTGDRFRALTPPFQHPRHKWDRRGHSITYFVAECDCGATQRWMMPGHNFAELAS